MRKKLLKLGFALLVLGGGVLELAPKNAGAAGCLYLQYCAPGRVACNAGCNGDAACLAACYDAYLDCCKI